MARTVALSTDRDDVIFGTTILESDAPATPSVLIFLNKAYTSVGGYGPAVPGHPEIADLYVETDSIVLKSVDVAPFEAPK